MNNEVRNFYEEESKYENLVLETKKLVEDIVNIDLEKLNKKILKVDKGLIFSKYVTLLEAVIGRDTNKLYYCNNTDDQKYYGLRVGEIYSREKLNPEIQSRIQKPTKLDTKARILLAPTLRELTLILKKNFSENLQVGDGDISTIDEDLILKKDIEYLEKLINYLDILQNEQGRLRIIAAEQEVFAYEIAKEQYQNKSSVEKWFLKTLKQEKALIQSMAEKNKGRR